MTTQSTLSKHALTRLSVLVMAFVLLGLSQIQYSGCNPTNNAEPGAETTTPDATAADTPVADTTKTPDAAPDEKKCPTPSHPCLPGCGNNLGVGQHCTRGGGECNTNKRAILCTGDFNKTTELVYCVRPCVKDEDCGDGAVCTRDPKDPKGGAGCIPASCVDRKPSETKPSEATPDAGSGE